MSRIEQITARAALTTDQHAKLCQEHEALLLNLVEAADDAARAVVEQQLAQVSSEKVASENKLAGLQKLIAKEKTLNTAAGKRAAFTEVEALFKRVQGKRTADCIAAGEAVLQAFSALAIPIAQWQQAKEQLTADARAVVARTCEGRAANDAMSAVLLLGGLSEGKITEALARALYSTGLGRSGPDFGDHLTLTEPSRISAAMSLTDALTFSNDRLLDHLRTHVERAAAELPQ